MPLQEKLKVFEEARRKYTKTAEHMTVIFLDALTNVKTGLSISA